MIDMNSISVLCPTRGRPELFKRMVESAINKGAIINESGMTRVRIYAYVDENDPTVDEYLRLRVPLYTGVKDGYRECAMVEIEKDHRIDIIVGPSNGVGVAWNILANKADGDLLMMANDDLVFKTPSWDKIIIDTIISDGRAAEDGIFVAWADDGAPSPNKRCAFPIIHRRWYETLGYFTPECFNFLWHDTWIHNIGKTLDRCIHIPDVLIEHRHFSFKKAAFDKTYERHRVGAEASKKRVADRDMFARTTKKRIDDADILRAVMTGGNNEA